MTTEQVFLIAAAAATTVSLFGIFDAVITHRVFEASNRAWDVNARVLARAGVRTASFRAVQMSGLLVVSEIATRIEPRPVVAEALEGVWRVLVIVCCISAIKEILAMWDRRHIVPDVTPPEGWEP